MSKFKVGDRVRFKLREVERGTVAKVSGENGIYVEWDDAVQGWINPERLLLESVDAINPAHYKRFPVEVIEITEHLNFCIGNAVKYLTRAGHKPGADEIEDLDKAIWYIQREKQRIEALKPRAEIVRDK